MKSKNQIYIDEFKIALTIAIRSISKEQELMDWYNKDYKPEQETTEGIFAPWAIYKKDFQEINGHDPLYAPQSKEDSDIFNRFVLNGYELIQTWRGFVYHMTCRGSRFKAVSYTHLTMPTKD